MLEHWNGVISTLQKLWVLWEIYITVDVNASFSIILSSDEIAKFEQAIYLGSNEFIEIDKYLSELDCRDASAEDAEDKREIFSRILDEGIYNVNCAVTAVIRQWLILEKGTQVLR